MNPLSRTITQFTFYAVAVILIAWTASLTYAFVQGALPHMPWYVPALSLVVFDLGMMAWMAVFLGHAQGTGQRAIALSLTVFDLFGVALMVVAEILLGGQQWAVAPALLGELAVWGIGMWTVGNVAAIVAYHLLSPAARQSMALQSEKDAIYDAAFRQLTEKRQAQGSALADVISGRLMAELRSGIVGDTEGQPVAHQLVATAAEHAREEPTIFPVNGARPTRPASKS